MWGFLMLSIQHKHTAGNYLQKKHIALFFRVIILLWVDTRVGLHALMFKNTSVFSYCSVQQHSTIPPLLQLLSLYEPPPSEYPVCSDWSAHTRLSQDRSPCLQPALSCFQHAVSFTCTVNTGINKANMWYGDEVWCQEVTGLKAELLTRCFR